MIRFKSNKRVYERMEVAPLAVEVEMGMMTGSPQPLEITPGPVAVTQYVEAEESGFTVSFD